MSPKRWPTGGNTEVVRPVIDRVLEKIDRDASTGCWNWQGTLGSEGYGSVHVRVGPGRSVMKRTHRVTYEHYKGPIPDGLVIDHLCRNRACCNPDHLDATTDWANILRGETAASRNRAKTHCQYGHEFTPENIYYYDGGKRSCRICKRRRSRESEVRVRERARVSTG